MNSLTHYLFFIGMLCSPCSLVSHTIGKQAPDFTLLDENSTERTLSSYKGSFVVMYFYPSDDTPGCTKQACSLRDSNAMFAEKNIVVLGISYDSPASHKKFKEKYNLPFTLLSDTQKKVAALYGAKRWWFLPWPKRMTFIIDKEGVVRHIMKDVTVSSHGSDILEKIDALKV